MPSHNDKQFSAKTGSVIEEIQEISSHASHEESKNKSSNTLKTDNSIKNSHADLWEFSSDNDNDKET